MGPYGLVHKRKDVVHDLSVELEADELEATLIRPLLLHFLLCYLQSVLWSIIILCVLRYDLSVTNQLALPCMVHKWGAMCCMIYSHPPKNLSRIRWCMIAGRCVLFGSHGTCLPPDHCNSHAQACRLALQGCLHLYTNLIFRSDGWIELHYPCLFHELECTLVWTLANMIDMIRRSSEVIDVDYNTSCSLINVPLDKNLCNLVN